MEREQDARMTAGDSRTLSIAVANTSGASLVGMTARYVVGPSPFGPEPNIIEKLSGTGIEIVTTGLPAGYDVILKVTLAHDDTKDVPPGWYYHEAVCTLASGAIITAMTGQLRIDPSLVASQL